jgi:hypothetical protein
MSVVVHPLKAKISNNSQTICFLIVPPPNVLIAAIVMIGSCANSMPQIFTHFSAGRSHQSGFRVQLLAGLALPITFIRSHLLCAADSEPHIDLNPVRREGIGVASITHRTLRIPGHQICEMPPPNCSRNTVSWHINAELVRMFV